MLESIERLEPGFVTAYAVYYYAPSDAGNRLEVHWALSEDLWDRAHCKPCRRAQRAGECPGLSYHATEAFERYEELVPFRSKEIGVFTVPSGLDHQRLKAEVIRQIGRGSVIRLKLAC